MRSESPDLHDQSPCHANWRAATLTLKYTGRVIHGPLLPSRRDRPQGGHHRGMLRTKATSGRCGRFLGQGDELVAAPCPTRVRASAAGLENPATRPGAEFHDRLVGSVNAESATSVPSSRPARCAAPNHGRAEAQAGTRHCRLPAACQLRARGPASRKSRRALVASSLVATDAHGFAVTTASQWRAVNGSRKASTTASASSSTAAHVGCRSESRANSSPPSRGAVVPRQVVSADTASGRDSSRRRRVTMVLALAT